MEPTEVLAGMLQWAGKNTAYHLDFIPDDRLSWKPAPEAKSALEIVQHVTGALTHLRAGIAGDGAPVPDPPLPASREEAKRQLLDATEACVGAIRALTPADFGRTVTLRAGVEFPMQRVVGIPLIDLVHHHGQIAYIETLLGDREDHFDPAAF